VRNIYFLFDFIMGGLLSFAMIGAASGAAGAAVNGGNIVTGALKGAFTAAAFYGVGSAFSEANCASCFSGGELTAAATVGKIAAHAMVGGVSSVLQGGKFGHGFFAAGVTQGFAKSINGISSARFSVGRIAAAAVIGGTISKITGGKFANGATTGAFSRMFNDEAHHQNTANRVAKEVTARGHFKGKGEADWIYQNNSDPDLAVTVDAGQLEVTANSEWGACPGGASGSCATADVNGSEYAVHGQVTVRARPNGTYGIYDQRYDYEMHMDFSVRGITRNFATFLGSPSGGWSNTGYWINYQGSVNISNPIAGQ
jgi:hypothetical protein